MALNCARPTRLGPTVSATYHKVVRVDLSARSAVIHTLAYLTEEHRRSVGARPVMPASYPVEGAAFDATFGQPAEALLSLQEATIQAAYAALKLIDIRGEQPFAGAQDS